MIVYNFHFVIPNTNAVTEIKSYPVICGYTGVTIR